MSYSSEGFPPDGVAHIKKIMARQNLGDLDTIRASTLKGQAIIAHLKETASEVNADIDKIKKEAMQLVSKCKKQENDMLAWMDIRFILRREDDAKRKAERERELADIEKQLKKQQEDLASLTGFFDKYKEVLAEYKDKIEKLINLQKQMDALNHQIKKIDNKIAELDDQIQQHEKQIEHNNTQIEQIDKQIDARTQQRRDSVDSFVGEMGEHYEGLKEEFGFTMSRSEYDNVVRDLASDEERPITNREEFVDELAQKLSEKLSVVPPELSPAEIVQLRKEQLQQIKDRLAGIVQESKALPQLAEIDTELSQLKANRTELSEQNQQRIAELEQLREQRQGLDQERKILVKEAQNIQQEISATKKELESPNPALEEHKKEESSPSIDLYRNP